MVATGASSVQQIRPKGNAMTRPDRTLRRRAATVALISTLWSLGTADIAAAQAWPSRTVIATMPCPAGTANDVVGRIVLDQLSRQLGQSFVVENRPGAGGTTGVASVARSTPDGYSLLVHSASFSSAYAIYRNLPYDTFADFVGVAHIGEQPTVLVSAPSKGFKTLADVVAAAKARPGELNFA